MKKIIFLLTISFQLTTSALANWESMGAGISGSVNALAVLNNTVYAGGNFSGNVTKYNEATQTWSTAGDGLAGTVNALVVHQGKLYAGGNFTTTGSNITCNYIAVLNSTTGKWDPVLGGFNNFVRALYSDGTNLYAGGAFVNSGSTLVTRIAQYSTSSWIKLGDPGGVVSAITKYYGKLHVAGNFSSNLLAVYDNNSWTKYGVGSISGVESKALAVYGDFLYVGGDFNGIAFGLVKFKNGSFSVPFNQLNNYVKSLLATPSRLFGGGAFTATTGGISLNHFFRYDGAFPFTDFGGINGNVLALANYNGRIIAAGSFTTAGGLSANNIARSTSTIDVDEAVPVVIEVQLFPNPVIERATLSFTTITKLNQPNLMIVDITGKVMDEVPLEEAAAGLRYTYSINRERLSAGLYYYLFSDGNSAAITGKFIVQ